MLAIEQLARDAGLLLKQQNATLATAESCTGGGLAYWITSIAGSSSWFDRGFITYSNAAKTDLLNVNPLTLDTFGAVSEQTAREMAEGALRLSKATVSVAITGTAGPDGGSPDKPVGTVWFAWMKRDQPTLALVQLFHGNREQIRLEAIEFALRKLIGFILPP